MSNINDHNGRINLLRMKAKRGLLTPAETAELQSSHKLIVGEPDANNANPLPIAVPAMPFADYSSWASFYNNGNVPEVVTVDEAGIEQTATSDESPDDEMYDDSVVQRDNMATREPTETEKFLYGADVRPSASTRPIESAQEKKRRLAREGADDNGTD